MAAEVATASRKSCFVVGPIGEEGSEIRKRSDQVLVHVIAVAVEACGYARPVRADHISRPGLVTTQIIDHLLKDNLVVADLTDHNANVFYELAVRHVVRKPVVQIIELGQTIPFDVGQSRTVQINHRDLDSVARGIGELRGHIASAEKDPMLADNPITTAIDLDALRATGDPGAKGTAEILEAVHEIRSVVNRIDSERGRRRVSRTLMQGLRSDVFALDTFLMMISQGAATPEARAEAHELVQSLKARLRELDPSDGPGFQAKTFTWDELREVVMRRVDPSGKIRALDETESPPKKSQ